MTRSVTGEENSHDHDDGDQREHCQYVGIAVALSFNFIVGCSFRCIVVAHNTIHGSWEIESGILNSATREASETSPVFSKITDKADNIVS